MPRQRFNRGRRIDSTRSESELSILAGRVRYGGNPEHKVNPGNFGLTPPAAPRADKSMCDSVGVFDSRTALGLLREGIKRGLVSAQVRGEFPQNVWAVTDRGVPVEGQLENRDQGIYHGYPMPSNDPLVESVLKKWKCHEDRISD